MIPAPATRLVLAAMLCGALLARAEDTGLTATQALGMDNNAFAFDLYSKLDVRDGNLFFSPYSVSTCLAMTYAGAHGETAKQIARTLHFNADPVALAAPFAALQKQLNSAPQASGVELNLANGLWAQQGHPFLPHFLDIAEKQYAAKLDQADFLTHSESIRHDINDWVSGKTKGKIADLLPERALDPQTRLVLVNAIYFKGRWANPFKSNLTTIEPFAVTPEQKIQAPLMHIQAQFNYAETADLQLLELPYQGGQSASNAARLTMVVLLPKDPVGFKSLEVALNSATLSASLSGAHRQEVSVFIPRFKMTDQFSLADTLSTMGMTDAFTTHADFSGMDGNFDLAISSVIHKAFVEVNEQGTEAAAATGVTVRATAVARPVAAPPVFRADHPFIFLIRDTESGSILFLGRLNDPTK